MKRVDAYLSSLGYCSRSEAKKFLKQNEVLFFENRVFNPSTKVNHNDVLINGEKLDSEKITILMNKPSGVICSHNDSGVLIYSLLPRRWQNRNPKISTIGRLDMDTTGAILLTDDGKLNHKLTSPKKDVKKIYEVTLQNPLKGDEKEIFESGTIILNDKLVHLEIVEGKYHQVKRMFAYTGNKVVKLHRLEFAGFRVDDLKEGEFRVIEDKF